MNLRAYRRFVAVLREFLPLLLAYARDRRRFLLFGGGRQVTPTQRRRRARALLNSFLTLGPTFIKLGQLLSTRPDILPPEYIDELSKLQDRVPPAPWEEAKTVLESEVGQIETAFDTFDNTAISGASLGQVYRAEIDDRPVAVKVRRPGVETLVAADLRVIRWSLPVVLYFVDEARSFSLETLADEFERVITQEMDYDRERRMLREIRTNFADDPMIAMPQVVESHCTGEVLTMEYIGGSKITDLAAIDEMGLDRTALARRLQRAYLRMVITDGVYHADPHPGNLAVRPDGTLVFYDFGMSGRVDPFVQEKIVDFYSAVARQDIDAILDSLVEMGTLSPEADRDLMADVMELAIEDARGQDIEHYRVQQIVRQVEDTIYEFPLRLPANLALVLRVATVVEGVCVTLDPDFDFIEVATGYLREEGYLEESAREFVFDRTNELQAAGRAALRTPQKIEKVLDLVHRGDLAVDIEVDDEHDVIRQFAKRLVVGLLLAATVLSTSVLYAFGSGQAAAVAVAVAVLLAVLLYRTFRRPRGIRARPQFTRQQLRKRREEEARRDAEFGEADTSGLVDTEDSRSEGEITGDDWQARHE